MSRKHQLREPQHVGAARDWWYYEENAGITVIVECIDEFGTISGPTRTVRIPWTRVRAALKRKDRKP